MSLTLSDLIRRKQDFNRSPRWMSRFIYFIARAWNLYFDFTSSFRWGIYIISQWVFLNAWWWCHMLDLLFIAKCVCLWVVFFFCINSPWLHGTNISYLTRKTNSDYLSTWLNVDSVRNLKKITLFVLPAILLKLINVADLLLEMIIIEFSKCTQRVRPIIWHTLTKVSNYRWWTFQYE